MSWAIVCLFSEFVILSYHVCHFADYVGDRVTWSARRGPGGSAPWRVRGNAQTRLRGSAPKARSKNAVEVACPFEQPFVRLSGECLVAEV
ncbi:hypothetical protein CsSME_00030247 [Camellia sinensis var. sinensis]